MGQLPLDSLEIHNFRGFQHLRIEKLGRVNLIVGRNNIGKSSLLDALELYARRGTPSLIWQILRTRTEYKENFSRTEENIDELLHALKYLFYGRKEVKDNSIPIHIGPIDFLDETLSIAVNWFIKDVDAQEGLIRWQPLQLGEYLAADNPVPRFIVSFGQTFKTGYSLEARPRPRTIFSERGLRCVSIGSNGLSWNQASLYWDKVTLTDLDDDILAALQIIAPGVIGLSFVGEAETPTNRIPLVRMKDIDEPLPLGSLGNGMLRVLGIVLALANAKDGMLLIDEIENGIHYSAQKELWQMIFRLAHRLNVQVFATTHSWDCIEAFQKAAEEDKQEEGIFIRLSLKKGEIVSTLFNEEELRIATRERLEVR